MQHLNQSSQTRHPAPPRHLQHKHIAPAPAGQVELARWAHPDWRVDLRGFLDLYGATANTMESTQWGAQKLRERASVLASAMSALEQHSGQACSLGALNPLQLDAIVDNWALSADPAGVVMTRVRVLHWFWLIHGLQLQTSVTEVLQRIQLRRTWHFLLVALLDVPASQPPRILARAQLVASLPRSARQRSVGPMRLVIGGSQRAPERTVEDVRVHQLGMERFAAAARLVPAALRPQVVALRELEPREFVSSPSCPLFVRMSREQAARELPEALRRNGHIARSARAKDTLANDMLASDTAARAQVWIPNPRPELLGVTDRAARALAASGAGALASDSWLPFLPQATEAPRAGRATKRAH